MKKLRVKFPRAIGSRFEALGVLRSKSWRKQTPIFFQKKCGSVFFNFLIRALLRPQIAIRRPANISCVMIHIWIVLNNAKYFVIFVNSRYQQNPEIISHAFVHFLCRFYNQIRQQVTISLFTDVLSLCCLLTDWDQVLILQCTM